MLATLAFLGPAAGAPARPCPEPGQGGRVREGGWEPAEQIPTPELGTWMLDFAAEAGTCGKR